MKIHPSATFGGKASVPGDKSVTHRSILFASLADGVSHIRGAGRGEDNITTIELVRQLGVNVEDNGSQITVHGVGLNGLKPPNEPIDCGNSGTTTRLVAGLFAGAGISATLVGDESLSIRPMRRVAEPLRDLGYKLNGQGDKETLPLHIDGSAKPDTTEPVQAVLRIASAQVKSCIMLAGLYRDGITRVVEPAVSRDHTERLLRALGARVGSTAHYMNPTEGTASDEAPTVTLYPNARLTGRELDIPGDISSAAFLLVAGLLRGEGVEVQNVGINPTRIGLLTALERMGVEVEYRNKRVLSTNEPVADLFVKPQPLQAITIEGADIPLLIDEIPVLAVLGAASTGRFEVRDAEELRVKESDRVDTTVAILRGMGIDVDVRDDGFGFDGLGEARWSAFEADSALDHRIGMAAAVAALGADGPCTIHGAEVIDVSFPEFSDVMRNLGAEIDS